MQPIAPMAHEQRGEKNSETDRHRAATNELSIETEKKSVMKGRTMLATKRKSGTNGKKKADGTPGTDSRPGRFGQKTIAEGLDETEMSIGKADRESETDIPLGQLCKSLQELQRERVSHLKSRIMLDNRLVSSIAVSLGYRSGLDEKARKEAFDAARKAIERIRKGERTSEIERALAPLILEASRSIAGFDRYVGFIEKRMVKLAERLPVVAWVKAPEQRGFGLLSLAILVGECGDLCNYANPGKLWRRMGCAPFESDGVMRMGGQWKRSKPGLSAAEWEEFGYSPRRRSIAYVFGENLVKKNTLTGESSVETEIPIASDGNGSSGAGELSGKIDARSAGPYRLRYDEVKAAKLALQSDDWPKLRCHRHAMLLATKRLMRELWKEWNPGFVKDQSW